jgi:hypothetical protein
MDGFIKQSTHIGPGDFVQMQFPMLNSGNRKNSEAPQKVCFYVDIRVLEIMFNFQG